MEEATGATTLTTTQGDTNAGAGAGSQSTLSFIDSLPEDIRGNESLKGFDSAEKLARAHLEAIGKLPVVPGSVDEYEITVPEGHPVDEKVVSQFKTWAHEAGLTKEQAATVASKYIEMEAAMMKTLQTNAESAQAAVKTEWGDKYDANLAVARKAVAQFCSKEDLAFLEESGLGNNPQLVRMFYKVGQAMIDDVSTTKGDGDANRMQLTKGGEPQLDFPSMQKTS